MPTAVGDVGEATTEPGVAVEQRDAEQEERRGERTEQEVLERRLLREQPASAGQAAQQVQRQREHLERDEHASAGRWPPGRAACRRPRTAPAGRPRSARQPAATGVPLVRAAGHGRAACGGERVAGRVEPRSAISSTPTNASTQDRALHEQRGPVDGDRALATSSCVPAPCRHDDGDERAATSRRRVSTQLRRERRWRGTNASTSTPTHGRAEDDEHRRQRAVLESSGAVNRPRARGHCDGPFTAAVTGDGRRRVGLRRPAAACARPPG